jgi:hypothetical protein
VANALDVDIDGNAGDWRIAAVARLAQAVPAAYPGGPSHEVGALVLQTSLVQTVRGDLIGFATPSAVALALDLASRASLEAAQLFEAVTFATVATPYGPGRNVDETSISTLYNFFEQCMLSAVFSFQALEAFCNQVILRELKDSLEVKRKEKRVTLCPNDLERQLSTNEKLSQVLPKIRSVPTPKGKTVWEPFKRLQQARDATVHLKASDQYSTDHESLFFQFFSHKASEFPSAAAEMIRYFYPVLDTRPRWLLRLSF